MPEPVEGAPPVDEVTGGADLPKPEAAELAGSGAEGEPDTGEDHEHMARGDSAASPSPHSDEEVSGEVDGGEAAGAGAIRR